MEVQRIQYRNMASDDTEVMDMDLPVEGEILFHLPDGNIINVRPWGDGIRVASYHSRLIIQPEGSSSIRATTDS